MGEVCFHKDEGDLGCIKQEHIQWVTVCKWFAFVL